MGQFFACIGLAITVTVCSLFGLIGLAALKITEENKCTMTYMYPNYIRIDMGATSGMIVNASLSAEKDRSPKKDTTRYTLSMYWDGWKKVDPREMIVALRGVPVLFIPGNAGSFRQVRSLASESERTFLAGPPLEPFSATGSDAAAADTEFPDMDEEMDARESTSGKSARQDSAHPPSRFRSRLDWFAVDFREELSAMDPGVANTHVAFVVAAINQILELYKELRGTEGAEAGEPPSSVILVGHSMGGSIARAATLHAALREGAVRTIITLAAPHVSLSVATQPSLVRWQGRLNSAWKRGYQSGSGRRARLSLHPLVLASICGGTRDTQVRSPQTHLTTLVPQDRAVSSSTTSMPGVWVGTDHLSIAWCNQLVYKVGLALLHLADPVTGQPYEDPATRHSILTRHFQSSLPRALGWLPLEGSGGGEGGAGSSTLPLSRRGELKACSTRVAWTVEPQEMDVFLTQPALAIVGLDGRRRWMDIGTMAGQGLGRTHFLLLTSLLPCFGLRVHLWHRLSQGDDAGAHSTDITSLLLPLPAGTPHNEPPLKMAPPTSMLLLTAEDMRGFRFLTLSLAPQPVQRTVFGKPTPASMTYAQFYAPSQSQVPISPSWLLRSLLRPQVASVEEGHPMMLRLGLPISPGVLPLEMSIAANGCNRRQDFEMQTATKLSENCSFACFPPLAIVWDPQLGSESILPSLDSALLTADPPPYLWQHAGRRRPASLVLLLDPHCAYRVSLQASPPRALHRFLLSYAPALLAFLGAVQLYALMLQAEAGEGGRAVPSPLQALAATLSLPAPLPLLTLLPTTLSLALAILAGRESGGLLPLTLAAGLCHVIATGCMAGVAAFLQLGLAAAVHVGVVAHRRGVRAAQGVTTTTHLLQRLPRIMSGAAVKPSVALAALSAAVAVLQHPALALLLTLGVELCAAVNSLSRHVCAQPKAKTDPAADQGPTPTALPQTQADAVGHGAEGELERHRVQTALLVLHCIPTAMLLPSLVAWIQMPLFSRTASFPSDWLPVLAIVAHGHMLSNSAALHAFPSYLSLCIPLPARAFSVSSVYGAGGVACALAGLWGMPHLVLYVIAFVGFGVMSESATEVPRTGASRSPAIATKEA